MAQLQHALFETVVGVVAQAQFTVGTDTENNFDIGDHFNPSLQGSQVVAAWYEAIDNIADLVAFHNITVNSGPTADDVTLHLKGGNRPALLRIRIHALFSR